MHNDTSVIKDMTRQMTALAGHTVESFLPFGKVRAEKNLIKTLRDNVTYPVDLLQTLHDFGTQLVSTFQSYDDRLLYNWFGYSDDDKKELICLANEESGKKVAPWLDPLPIEFVDFDDTEESPGFELLGQMVYDDADKPALLKLSNKLLHRSAPEAIGVTAHERAHGIVSQYCQDAQDISKGKAGVVWSKYGDSTKFYLNPEEALVRAFEVNIAECLAPDSSEAARIRQITIDEPGYGHMAAAKQYFDFVKK